MYRVWKSICSTAHPLGDKWQTEAYPQGKVRERTGRISNFYTTLSARFLILHLLLLFFIKNYKEQNRGNRYRMLIGCAGSGVLLNVKKSIWWILLLGIRLIGRTARQTDGSTHRWCTRFRSASATPQCVGVWQPCLLWVQTNIGSRNRLA